MDELDVSSIGSDWVELADYGKTSGYQVARELNLASALPVRGLEFGTVDSKDGSVLVVRKVEENA